MDLIYLGNSISVISVFAKKLKEEQEAAKKVEPKSQQAKDDVKVIINPCESKSDSPAGVKDEDGIVILEALSATGLRSIRYAKEIPGVKEIVANDLSYPAVQDIKNNIALNNVEHLVTSTHGDAM